jgi:signal transduction histidine kinase
LTPERVFDRVSDEAAIRLGRAVGVISMVSATASVVIFLAIGELETWYLEYGVHNAVGGFLFGLLLFVAVDRQPRNGAVWAVGWSALFQSLLGTFAAAVATLLVVERYGNAAVADYRSISDLPTAITFFTWVGEWTWIPAIGLMMIFGFLLFPDGRLPGPRWRIVAWVAGISITAATIGLMTAADFLNAADNLPPLTQAFMPFVGLSIVAAVASLFFRYRRAHGDQRQQLRWMALAATILGGSFSVTFLLEAAGVTDGANGLNLAASLASLPLLVGAYGVAVLKYRLYDIDVVISKSVTYLGLAAVITLLYAAVVVGPLLVLGESDGDGPGLLLPIVATAVVALLFEPIRKRMQRWANRLVYGDRASPHEVLSQVTARLSDAPGSAGIDDLARLLADGTGADQAVVWMRSGDSLRAEGMWSRDGLGSDMPLTTDGLAVDEFTEAVSVRHEDVELGALSISKPHNDPVTPADRELLADVAAGAALVLRNMRLNKELEERANDVRQSRRRLISAQDAERHRLERDLHDGAQQQVVALKVKLGIAKTLAQREGGDEIALRVVALAEETQHAVDALRAVAHGIYPPLLESEGLEPALRTIERSSPIPIAIDASGLSRYDRSVEETAFFCVLETLERARMSGAASARVGLVSRNGDLVIEIDVRDRATDVDLTAVADRVDAAGGTLTIDETPDNQTLRIASSVPAEAKRLETA